MISNIQKTRQLNTNNKNSKIAISFKGVTQLGGKLLCRFGTWEDEPNRQFKSSLGGENITFDRKPERMSAAHVNNNKEMEVPAMEWWCEISEIDLKGFDSDVEEPEKVPAATKRKFSEICNNDSKDEDEDEDFEASDNEWKDCRTRPATPINFDIFADDDDNFVSINKNFFFKKSTQPQPQEDIFADDDEDIFGALIPTSPAYKCKSVFLVDEL